MTPLPDLAQRSLSTTFTGMVYHSFIFALTALAIGLSTAEVLVSSSRAEPVAAHIMYSVVLTHARRPTDHCALPRSI